VCDQVKKEKRYLAKRMNQQAAEHYEEKQVCHAPHKPYSRLCLTCLCVVSRVGQAQLQELAHKDLEMRLQAERHARHAKSLEDTVAKMKRARDGVYNADRNQQRKMIKVLNEFDDLAWEVERTELAAQRVWAELEEHEDELPLPLLAVAQRTKSMMGDTVTQLTTERKAAGKAVADAMKGVREAHMKNVGPH